MSVIDNFEAMLARGQDSGLLRFSLGNAYLGQNDPERAIPHLAEAVRLTPEHSASWKLYGKALAAVGRQAEALAALDQGIATAEAKGDVQAAKEMQVFRKRALKTLESGED
jgi:predicted Zn-dependent protease